MYDYKFYKYYRKIGRKILPIFFPRHCPVCGDIVPYGAMACQGCYNKIPFIREPSCFSCGKPVNDETQEYCYDCRSFPKSFQGGCSLMLYNDLTKTAMMQFKYKNRRVFADFFADELIRRYSPLFLRWHLTAVAPVPVHRAKKKLRGYNQAALLSIRIASALQLQHCPDLLIRKVNTPPQKQFTPAARLHNLSGVFSFNEKYASGSKCPKCVLLVDDIYTTGATMEACTRILLKSGVKKVYISSICIGVSAD